VKKGIVLELDEEFVTLLTPEGEFIEVKKDGDYKIGEEIEAQVMKKPIVRRRSFRYVIISFMAAAALLVATLFHFPSNAVYAYMSIDINPSIEVAVDEQLKVLKLKAYNVEGKRIVSQLSHWKKKAFVDIAKEVIDLSMKKGYLQQGGQVLIATVERKHSTASSRKLSTALTKIKYSYQQKNIIVKTEKSTMEVRNKAVKKGMTTGKLLQIEQKTKAVPPTSTKAEKLEKPLKQNDGDKKDAQQINHHSLDGKNEQDHKKNKHRGNEKNEQQLNHHPLHKKNEQNHKKNKHSGNEKSERQMNNHLLQKKDKQKREENNSNEKKGMQKNHHPSEEKDEQKQKKSNDKELSKNGKNHKSSAKNNKHYNSHRSHDHHLKHQQKKNNKRDEHPEKPNYDKNSQRLFKHDEHENEHEKGNNKSMDVSTETY
jgi:Anti-sigma factor N-terminus